MDVSYRTKLLMNENAKPSLDSSNSQLFNRLNPNMFSLNQIHNQYMKNIGNLGSFDAAGTLSRTPSSSMMDDMARSNCENIAKKPPSDFQVKQQQFSASKTNDKNNNNKSSVLRDKSENSSYEATAEKSGQVVHINSKTGVSLKCAYCELREDFKSR